MSFEIFILFYFIGPLFFLPFIVAHQKKAPPSALSYHKSVPSPQKLVQYCSGQNLKIKKYFF